MSIPVDSLTTKDYELLLFISKFDSISRTEIHSKMKRKVDSIDYRLSQLSEVSYRGRFAVKDSSFIKEEFDSFQNSIGETTFISKDSFHITDLGKKVLQDYMVHIKEEQFEFLKRSVLVPIVVAALTTLVIHLLKYWLELIL